MFVDESGEFSLKLAFPGPGIALEQPLPKSQRLSCDLVFDESGLFVFWTPTKAPFRIRRSAAS
jgi:hypothetical protein